MKKSKLYNKFMNLIHRANEGFKDAKEHYRKTLKKEKLSAFDNLIMTLFYFISIPVYLFLVAAMITILIPFAIMSAGIYAVFAVLTDKFRNKLS